MKLVFSILIILFSSQSFNFGQTQYPKSNILLNTFPIDTDTLAGTCFLVDHTNIEYLVTAKHLFKRNTKSEQIVDIIIEINDSLHAFRGKIFFHSNLNIDIAVIKLPTRVGKISKYPIGGKMTIGQDCYFLGFPYEERLSTQSENLKIRIPFVKKAILSGIYNKSDFKILFLDGHNNPGFSGGPIVFFDQEDKINKIFGVVSAYYPQNNQDSIQIGNIQFGFTYSENSGIIIGYPAKAIEEIIDEMN